MQIYFCRPDSLIILAVFIAGHYFAYAALITPSAASSTSSILAVIISSPVATCEFRTINYITHCLPQVCLRYARGDSTRLESPHVTPTDEKPSTLSEAERSPEESGTLVEEFPAVDSDADSALDDSSFLSFEDWKKQTLEKEGLLDPNTGERRAQASKDGERRRSPDGIQDALKVLEEDVVIDTDFTALLGNRGGEAATKVSHSGDKPAQTAVQDVLETKGVDENRRFRSKDAGKTCKERSNFASLDAGGQVMKTNPEAKSASALLKEDRDVYMLNSCQAKNKFLIVELSESILVETVAMANFEFFSSTFRQFRVSVSDQYPVKLDRWVDLGTFEARNSRDMQAFLVEDPRIWARYLRVEILSHYGNEFYCPVSLLRVHGRTMIQDVLGMEEPNRGEDDTEDSRDHLVEENDKSVPEIISNVLEDENRVNEGLREAEAALEELVKTAEAITFPKRSAPLNSSQILEAKRWLENVSLEQTTTPWVKDLSLLMVLFELHHFNNICLPSEAPLPVAAKSQKHLNENNTANRSYHSRRAGRHINDSSTTSIPLERPGIDKSGMTEGDQATKSPILSSSSSHDPATIILISKESAISQPVSEPSIIASATTPNSGKSINKTSPTTSLHSPQPTTQESFFKTVTKRLQLLEANSTLSLKYIEEQSKILRDAFTKVEKRQLAKTTSFLENLNATVWEELRKFSKQYDEIWQSTVIELEIQRDQSQREIAAVSTRLSMLADELVFQKRMSIVQSILLLLCLGLVIFSRNPAAGYLDIPVIQNMVARTRNFSDIPVDSTPNSPPTNRTASSLRGKPWPSVEHRRQRSDDSAGSLRSASREYSPPTPVSAYSRLEENPKRIYEENDLLKGFRNSLVGNPLMTQNGHSEVADPQSPSWQDSDVIPEGENYPDFRNSALWLAPDSTILDANNFVHDEETIPDRKLHSPNQATYKSESGGLADTYLVESEIRPFTQQSHLPSILPKMERPEFSIARKPLPALPKDDQRG